MQRDKTSGHRRSFTYGCCQSEGVEECIAGSPHIMAGVGFYSCFHSYNKNTYLDKCIVYILKSAFFGFYNLQLNNKNTEELIH
jgi:hypothetical protein